MIEVFSIAKRYTCLIPMPTSVMAGFQRLTLKSIGPTGLVNSLKKNKSRKHLAAKIQYLQGSQNEIYQILRANRNKAVCGTLL